MAFSAFAHNAKTYTGRSESNYLVDSLGFSDPTQGLKITGGSKNSDGSFSGAFSYTLQKDIGTDNPKRQTLKVVTSYYMSSTDFDDTDVIEGIGVTNAFAAVTGNVDRAMLGEE